MCSKRLIKPTLHVLEYIRNRCTKSPPTCFGTPWAPSGFGCLEVARWPLVPKFAGSNPTEAVGFFRAKKSSARLPSEGK